jgi:hypothetical protein
MPAQKGRGFAAVLEVVGWRVPIALALVAGYLIAAPGAVNPAAPEEAAAFGTCTGYGGTLSVRAGGGRLFGCGTGFDNASASCGTLTQEFGIFAYRFESDSCLGPATFSWESEGTLHVQNMNIEANGNEPPECDPPEPGTTIGNFPSGVISVSCLDMDFDDSGGDLVQSSTTPPLHGYAVPTPGVYSPPISYQYICTQPGARGGDSFSINIGDDYSPNPKSLPPIHVSVYFPYGSCWAGNDASGQRATALEKCIRKAGNKHWSKKKLRKCKKKANLLPV